MRAVFAAALWALLAWAFTAWRPPGEILAMPGKVIAGHARWESDCQACHARFERAAQPGLCLQCHQDIAADIRSGRLHRFAARTQCRQCHGEHRGRQARSAAFETAGFDHARTRFPLEAAHRTASCPRCHTATTRGAPDYGTRLFFGCRDCHRGDDVHANESGQDCSRCHATDTWRSATAFDHARTAFPLAGKHRAAGCRACHREAHRYASARTTCLDCHAQARGLTAAHRQLYGEHCERCHAARDWRTVTFDHDRGTSFALTGKHRRVRCEACHRGPAPPGPAIATVSDAGSTRDEDIALRHTAPGGGKCTACHDAARCQDIRDRRATKPAAAGTVVRPTARCDGCHWQAAQAEKSGAKQPSACVTCHLEDDTKRGHRRRLGARCERCHDARGWNPWERASMPP